MIERAVPERNRLVVCRFKGSAVSAINKKVKISIFKKGGPLRDGTQ